VPGLVRLIADALEHTLPDVAEAGTDLGTPWASLLDALIR